MDHTLTRTAPRSPALARQEHAELALVGHSGWLLAMLAAVCDCGAHQELTTWFETCEIRSVVLTFDDRLTDQAGKLRMDD